MKRYYVDFNIREIEGKCPHDSFLVEPQIARKVTGWILLEKRYSRAQWSAMVLSYWNFLIKAISHADVLGLHVRNMLNSFVLWNYQSLLSVKHSDKGILVIFLEKLAEWRLFQGIVCGDLA